MVEIAKSCFDDRFVPTEHREITLMEFKASVAAAGSRSAASLDGEMRRCSVFS